MQKAVILFIAVQFAVAALAGRMALPPLTPSGFADTESTTNAPLACWTGSRTLAFELALEATASNNVEIAIGRDDAPPDGSLSLVESAMRFGWDGGRWFLEAPGLTNRVEAAPSSVGSRRYLRLELAVRPDGSVRALSVRDGDAPILLDAALTLPAVNGWNMMRATARGCEPAQEGIVVRSFSDKTQVFVK
jgi:hypothetical protein